MEVKRGKLIAVCQSLRSGGAEKQLLLLCRELQQKQWDVEVWSLAAVEAEPRINGLIEEAQRAGVVVRRGRWANIVGALVVLIRLLAVRRSVVWAWGFRAEVVTQLASLLNWRIRLVLSLRWAMEARIRRECQVRRWIGHRVRGFISNSKRSCRLVREMSEKDAAFYVVPNVIPPDERVEPVALPEEPPRPLKIAVVGHFRTWQKGYDLLPELIRNLKKRSVQVEIHLGGRNDDGGDFLADLQTEEFAGLFHYHGVVTDLQSFFNQSHLYLMISRAEGMSNSLMEAMQYGLPCISTEVGDVGDVFVDKAQLRVAPVDSIETITELIANAVKNWEKTRAMAIAGRRFCLEYSSQSTNVDLADKALQALSTQANG